VDEIALGFLKAVDALLGSNYRSRFRNLLITENVNKDVRTSQLIFAPSDQGKLSLAPLGQAETLSFVIPHGGIIMPIAVKTEKSQLSNVKVFTWRESEDRIIIGTYVVQCIVEIGSISSIRSFRQQRSKQLLRAHTNRPLIEYAEKKST